MSPLHHRRATSSRCAIPRFDQVPTTYRLTFLPPQLPQASREYLALRPQVDDNLLACIGSRPIEAMLRTMTTSMLRPSIHLLALRPQVHDNLLARTKSGPIADVLLDSDDEHAWHHQSSYLHPQTGPRLGVQVQL